MPRSNPGAIDLLLVRHGETEWNRLRRYQGHRDVPLSEVGVAQAAALTPVLAELQARSPLVYSSDLIRARQTAEIACPWAVPRVDQRLREMFFGAFEGCTHDECIERFGEHYNSWRADPGNGRAFEGESVEEFHARLDSWLLELPATGTAIAFAHGGVLRLLASRAHGMRYDDDLHIPPTSAVWLRVQEGRIAEGVETWLK